MEMKFLRAILVVTLTNIFVDCAPEKRSIENDKSRIVNGYVSKPGQFPYQALLKIARRDRESSCGGCVISNEWILTAGHCVANAIGFEVHLGAHRFEDVTEVGRIILKTNISILHQGYNQLSARDDIGLIRLPKAVPFSDRIRPVLFPNVVESFVRQEVIASGWGRTVANESQQAEELNYIPMYVISNDECVSIYPLQVRSTVICARGEYYRNVCSGDSGGPLTLKDSNVLVGLTSFGHRSGCDTGNPSGFTRVTSYMSWIRSRTGISTTENVHEYEGSYRNWVHVE